MKERKRKFYVVEYENGAYIKGEFATYSEVRAYAEKCSHGYGFSIDEYENEQDYLMNI